MPADDTIYTLVKTALQNDGWQITHDPYFIEYRDAKLYADLGAEWLFAAERLSCSPNFALFANH